MTEPVWTGRPARLIVNLQGNAGEVAIEQDGIKTPLRMVTDIHIDEYGMATVAMMVPNTDLKVEVSDMTAEAILRTNSRRVLSFLTDDDAAAMKDVRRLVAASLGLEADDSRMLVLDKILRELERRAEVPF